MLYYKGTHQINIGTRFYKFKDLDNYELFMVMYFKEEEKSLFIINVETAECKTVTVKQLNEEYKMLDGYTFAKFRFYANKEFVVSTICSSTSDFMDSIVLNDKNSPISVNADFDNVFDSPKFVLYPFMSINELFHLIVTVKYLDSWKIYNVKNSRESFNLDSNKERELINEMISYVLDSNGFKDFDLLLFQSYTNYMIRKFPNKYKNYIDDTTNLPSIKNIDDEHIKYYLSDVEEQASLEFPDKFFTEDLYKYNITDLIINYKMFKLDPSVNVNKIKKEYFIIHFTGSKCGTKSCFYPNDSYYLVIYNSVKRYKLREDPDVDCITDFMSQSIFK